MRDPQRIDRILEKLAVVWHEQPDTRLTQLLHTIMARTSWQGTDLFYLDDLYLEQELDKHITES